MLLEYLVVGCLTPIIKKKGGLRKNENTRIHYMHFMFHFSHFTTPNHF